MLDANGVIVAKYFEEDYRQRYTASDILMHQFGLLPESVKSDVTGRQLRLTATASNSIVATGQRVALALDIQLNPGMHVYAPGVEGYIAIDWRMKDSPAVTLHDAVYPASEKLHLKAIDETVPVYRGHVRLNRDITMGPDAQIKPLLDANGKFAIEGVLRYQACDDQVCYVPQELPIRWTFQYADFDRQRVPEEMQRKAPAK